MNTWSSVATCVVCGEGFTPAEWNDRHWPIDGGEAHARCCPDCNGPQTEDEEEEEAEYPLVERNRGEDHEDIA